MTKFEKLKPVLVEFVSKDNGNIVYEVKDKYQLWHNRKHKVEYLIINKDCVMVSYVQEGKVAEEPVDSTDLFEVFEQQLVRLLKVQ